MRTNHYSQSEVWSMVRRALGALGPRTVCIDRYAGASHSLQIPGSMRRPLTAEKKHSGIVLHAVNSCRNTVGRALSHSTSAHTHTLTYGSLSIVINTSHGKLFLRPVHFPLPCLALRIRRSYLSRKFRWNQSWILIAA